VKERPPEEDPRFLHGANRKAKRQGITRGLTG